jgi:septal ring factor EnvC (AmiA/AmiB activator)
MSRSEREKQQMTDTVTDHRAELEAQIARLDAKIEEIKHAITCSQDELGDLEAERADLFEKLSDELDAEEATMER